MKLSEMFKASATHNFKIAKDPWMLGLCLTFAACAFPFSTSVAAYGIAAPLAYAGLGAGCKLAGMGLKKLGK